MPVVKSLDRTNPTTILDAATAEGEGQTWAVPPAKGVSERGVMAFSWMVLYTDLGGSNAQVKIEGSLDGSNWFQLDINPSGTADTFQSVVNKPCPFLRANVVDLPANASVTVIITF